jgi:hypothetical protein
MSLYELESMMRAIPQLDGRAVVEPTDEEWSNAEDLLAKATAGLADVRL